MFQSSWVWDSTRTPLIKLVLGEGESGMIVEWTEMENIPRARASDFFIIIYDFSIHGNLIYYNFSNLLIQMFSPLFFQIKGILIYAIMMNQ